MEALNRILGTKGNRRAGETNGFIQLFISKRLIQGAAAALLAVFVPIFIYETTGQQFYIVGLYYALLSFLYAIFLVPGMKVTNYIGFGRALVVGGVFSVIQYAIMFFMTPQNIYQLLIPFTISVVIFRVFHWVPYHVDFTLFTKKGERGRMVSLSFATIAFMGVVGPILAGFIIKYAGYQALFLVSVILLMIATVSYAFVPATNVYFEWSFFETCKRLFGRENRGVIVGEFANGAEVAVTLIVWPIFLYEILDGDVFEIGAVSTIIVAITIIIQIFVGRYLDGQKGNSEKTLKLGSTFYAIGWILKIFVLSAAQVFFVGLYHNIVKIFTKTPFSAILYDMSAEQGRYIDEFTVLREMSNHTGRTCGLCVVAALSLSIPIAWTFVVAAIASLALNMVYQVQK